MARRKISKASKRRLSFFGPICIIIILYFLFSLLYNVYTIYTLTVEKNNLEKKYYLLQEESERLKTDIEKLNDEKYLADYARENYKYSKEGEYILQVEKEKEAEEELNSINFELNKNYILICISVFLFFMFVHLIRKNKREKKKHKKKK